MPEAADRTAPLSRLPAAEKARRSRSFGSVASDYERYRQGPPPAVVDWFVPDRVERIVDLGAGTGALTRLLIGRADEVVAVEPDDRMRAVLAENVPGATALSGTGESLPLPDAGASAVLASSSWHWMDPVPTLHEVARVLVPGGTLGAVWSGIDPDGAFLRQAQELLAGRAGGTGGDGEATSLALTAARRSPSTLEIPAGVPFDQPEHATFSSAAALDADDLIGLLGTLSWVIVLPDDRRHRLLDEARRLLAELLGVEGDVTVDLDLRAEAWRTRRVG